MSNLNNLKEGGKIKCGDDVREVLAILGRVVCLSFHCEAGYTATWFEIKKLEDAGWQKVEEGWRPENGERYIYLDGCGDRYWVIWTNEEADQARLKMNNVFKTEAELEKRRQFLIDNK